MSKLSTAFAVITVLASGTLAAHAQNAGTANLGQHPAVFVRADLQTIDPNSYIVQPPASVSWVRSRSNLEHPAVVVARRATATPTAIDSNTFQVQPPASVTWKQLPVEGASQRVAASSH